MADFANLVLGVDTSGLKRGERDLKSFGAQGERTERKIDKFGGSASRSLGAVALAATAAIGAFMSLGAAVRIIADFETSMSRLGAVSRATAGELEALRDIAKDLGSTTEFSASQAADGLNFLAMAGFNATEAMAAIPSVLDLATASGLGLAEAADTASNIMSGFGIEAANAAEVADVLAAASTRANTTVGQLGAAMSTVAPIASALDMSLEDTAAAIGVLSDAGIQGERAGTGLRGVLASLAGPTTQAEAVLRGLGLTIADVDPATNDLSVVMARLGAAGLSTADAMTLFGREAASGALVLIDGAQRVGDFGDELERANGAAGDMAATMRDNLGGDLKGAASAAQGLAIALGDAGLTAIIRGAVQAITGLVRGITAAVEAFSAVTGFILSIGSLETAFDNVARASDAVNLSIDEQIRQQDSLTIAMDGGRVVSLDYAGAMLENSRATLVSAEATRVRRIEEVKATEVYQELVEQQAAANRLSQDLQNLFSGGPVSQELQRMADASLQVNGNLSGMLELYQSTLGKIRANALEQEALTGTVKGTSDEVLRLEAEIRLIEASIKDAENGVVNLGNAFNGTAAAAAGVTSELAASLALLARMDALGPQQSSAGRGRGGDPRNFGGGFLDRSVQEADAFIASLNQITKAAGSGGGGASAAIKELEEELTDAEKATIAAAEAFDGKLTSAVDSVADAFGDWIASGFQDFKGMMDNIIGSFKSMISQLIATAIANPIKIALGIGGGGAAGMASQAMGGSGIIGSALGGLGSLSGGIASGASVAFNGIMAGGGLGPAMGAISGGVGMGGMAGIGTAIGAAALPLAAVFAVVSFFRSKTKTIDSGIKGIISMEDAAFESFKEIEKSRFFGLSKKRSTSFNTLTGDDSAPLDAAVFAVRESVIGATESLGVSIDVFNGFTHDFTLSLKGLDEAARTAAITEEFARMGDSMAGLVPNIANMNQLFAVAANRVGLIDRLLQAQGETEELTARIRAREMDATNELNKSLLAQVFAAEDAAAAVNKLTASFSENAFATGVDFRRGLSRAANGIETTPQQSQAEMLAELKALNARIDVLQSTSEITANSSSQTAENTDYSNALTLDAAT